MAKKQSDPGALKNEVDLSPLVAASLAGIIYQARLFNRQARMSVPEDEVIAEVLELWQTVKGALTQKK